ncbi:MAG: hypothetical protein JNL18_09545 [Planctomycetaceae bacterium]|nr:hypothetical protein [Planctomycetaceae bacterium]
MHRLPLLLSAFSAAWLAGCNIGGTSAPSAEEHLIRTLVGQTAELQASPQRFAACFVEESAADETLRKKFKGMMTRMDRAAVDDANASATASVLFEVLETGEQLGPVEWQLEKVNGQWKVRTLAVPDVSGTSAT